MPLIVLAGKMYGSGSSRDWAAKGPYLLGVRAVIAESFERIHRSNLIGMGVLPLEFEPGECAEALGLTGLEEFSFAPAPDTPMGADGIPTELEVTAKTPSGDQTAFRVRVRVDTPTEAAYVRSGGILPYVLNQVIR